MGFKPRRDLEATIARLVPELYDAYVAYGKRHDLWDDQTFAEALGEPCTAAQIAALDHKYEAVGGLPPSYRAFLELYGHWEGVPGCAGADLLGPEGHTDPHIVETLGWKSDFFVEFEGADNNPLAKGAIPLVVGDDRNMILLEQPRRADGELQVVQYYLTEEVNRYGDLVEMLSALIRRYRP